MSFGQSGPYAGRELICYNPNNIWLVECDARMNGVRSRNLSKKLRQHKLLKVMKIYFMILLQLKVYRGWNTNPVVDGVSIELQDRFH